MGSLDEFLAQPSPLQDTASAPETPFAKWYSGEDEATRLGLAYQKGVETSPDQAAQVLRLQAKTGLPQDLIERNQAAIELEARKSDFDPMKFRQASPIVAQWLSENPNNTAVASEDLTKLSYLERQFRFITGSFGHGKLTTELADIGDSAWQGTDTPAQRNRQAQIEKEMSQNLSDDYGITGFFEQIPGMMANQVPIFGQSMKGKAQYAVEMGVGGAAVGAGAGLMAGGAGAGPGAAAGMTAGAVFGWRYGAAVTAAKLEGTLAFLEFEKIKDDHGLKLDQNTAKGAAAIVGVINGGLEMMGLEEVMRGAPGFAPLRRSAIKEALKSPTTSHAFLSYAERIGAAMGSEGLTEGLQELVKSSAGELSKMAQDGSISSLSTGAILHRLFNEKTMSQALSEARGGAQAGGGMTAIHAGGLGEESLRADLAKARNAQNVSTGFMELGKKVQDLKVFERMPEATQEIIHRLSQNGPAEKVFAPVEAWNTYWQGKNIDPKAAATEILGSPELYDEAMRTGGDIPIPTARYAVTIAPSEHNEFFAQELRSNPDAMNAREAKEFVQNLDAEEAKAVAEQQKQEEAQKAQPASEEPSAEIASNITQQLQATGMDEKTAGSQAQVYQSFFNTLGKRLGVDPVEMFKRYNLQVQKKDSVSESTQEGQSFDQAGKPIESELQTQTPIPDNIPVLNMQKDMAFDGLESHAIRKTSLEDAKAQTLRGTVQNDHTKWKVNISGEGLKKSANMSVRPEQATALRNIRTLIESGIWLRSAEDRHQRSDVLGFHYLYAPFHSDGKTYVAKIGLREALAGSKKKTLSFYTLHVQEIKKAADEARPGYILGDASGSPENQTGINSDYTSERAPFDASSPSGLESTETGPGYILGSGETPSGEQSITKSQLMDFVNQARQTTKLFQASLPAPTLLTSPLGFYSQLDSEITKMDFNSIPAKDLAGRIKNIQGVKAEELEFTGLLDYLKLKEDAGQKVTKQEVQEYLKTNGVEISQVVLSNEYQGDDATSSVAGLEWSEQERDNSGDSDDISNEIDNYLSDKDWVQEQKENLKPDLIADHTDETGKINEEALNEALDQAVEEQANKYAEETVESDEFFGARFEVTESTTGWTLSGNDEMGWYNSETRTNFEDSLEEAKIKLAALMIEKGEIEGDKSQLTREQDIKWRGPRGVEPSDATLKKNTNALFKKDKARLLKESKEDTQWWSNETPTEEEYEKDAKRRAHNEVSESYNDPKNPKNKIHVAIDHALLNGSIDGNDKKGYVLNYYNALIPQDRHTRTAKASSEKTVQLQAHTIEDAKKEALTILIEKKLVTAKPAGTVDEALEAIDINKPTGKPNWERYKVPGGENYREILLTLPKNQGEPFKYDTHFRGQENFLAHIRVTDRVDTEGRKTLFIEELQSDWHQQGRERGYKTKQQEGYDLLEDGKLTGVHPTQEAANQALEIEKKSHPDRQFEVVRRDFTDKDSGVPNAPFKNTDAWAALAMKRMIRMAVDGGYDALAWTPSEVHVDRWGTDSIGWVKKAALDTSKWKAVPSQSAGGYQGEYQVLNENGELAHASNTSFMSKEAANNFIARKSKANFLVGSVEQRGGNADGLNIEEAARAQGKLLERNGERITTKEELHKVVADTLGRERNERSLESLTDSIWKQMQENEVGSKFPRKEGMEFFYDNLLPRKVMPAILKKLDTAAKVEVTKISLGSDGFGGVGGVEKTMDVLTVPLTDALKAKTQEGFTLFQPGDENDPRGRIQFNGQSFKIDLLKDADLSTFLHETGHFYLEVLGDAASSAEVSPEVAKDYETVLKWLGVESREDIKPEHHEKWARGFEAYLMEGKAPTPNLRAAFARFKSWLVSIYKELANLNVQLTPEVRGVFDRLLATQDQIAIAQKEQKMEPLFPDPMAVGMNEVEAKAYSKVIAEARQASEEELATKLMAQVRREQTAEYKAAREIIETLTEEEVNQRPEYIALAMLQKGTLPDGSPLPEGMEAIKLSRKAIVEQFGEERLKSLPKPYVYSRSGGVHPDFAASLFGFKSGDELLNVISKAEKREFLVDRLTDERMKLEHGDLFTDGKLPVEAMKAAHTEKRALLLRKELEYLASNNFPALKGMIKKVARRIPTLQLVRQQAEEIISRKTIRDINPLLYQRAEARSAREAMDSLLRGDFESAFEAKQRELLNHELYRAATSAKEETDSIVEYMNKFTGPSTRKRIGKAGGDYLDQIDSILERFDFSKSVSLRKIDKRKSLLAWMQDQQDLGFTPDIPEKLLNEAYRKHYKDLTFDELTGIRDTTQNIEHLAGLFNKLLAHQKSRDLATARAEIIASILAHHTMNDSPPDFAPGLKKILIEKVDSIIAGHTRMEFLFEHLDGNKPHGPVWEHLFKPFADAEDNENTMMRDVVENMNRLFGVYPRKERATWFFHKTHIAEINSSMTKANMLTVALNWGNEYNRDALMRGYGWSEAQIQAIFKHLDERDWKTVQGIWDYIDTFWPKIAEMEKDLNGFVPEKVQASPVETPYGTLKGGYYPIVFDSKLSWKQSKIEEKSNVRDMFGGTWARAMTRHGHIKERDNTGGKPILLELTGLTQHVTNVVHDLNFRREVIDVSRLIGLDDVRETIQSALGREMYKQLNPWLSSIAGDRRGDYINPMEGILGRARMGATVVNLGWKMTSAIVQTLGYTYTAKELGGKYAAYGLRDAFAKPWELQKQWDFITERSPMMRDRLNNYDRDVRDTLKRLNVAGVKPGILSVTDTYTQGLRDSYFSLVGYMDLATSVPTWLGAYRKAMDGGLENIEKGHEKEAVEFADSVVRRTQAAGAAKDLAGVQRGNEAWKLFTMFYSQLSLQFNHFQKTHQQFKIDKNVPKLLGSLALMWFVPAVLEDVLRGNTPDGDDDEKWRKWLIKNEMLYPFQSIVLVRDIANGMDRYGYEPSAAFNAFDSLVKTTQVGVGLITGEKDGIERKDLKSALMTTGYFAGLPSRQIWLSGEYFYDWMTGEQQPSNPVEGIWRTLVTGKKKE